METIRKTLKDFDVIAADHIGRSGGVAMLWRKGLALQLLSMSRHRIDVALKVLGLWSLWLAKNQHKTYTCSLVIYTAALIYRGS